MVVRCVWDAEVQGSNPCTPTNLKLLPVELALGLRNRVAKVRFLPRVPNYDSQVIEFFKSGDIYINNGYLNKVLLLTVVNYHNYHPFYGVCSIKVVPKVVNLESAGSIPVIHPKHRKIARVVDRSSLLRSRTVRFRGFESHIFLQLILTL